MLRLLIVRRDVAAFGIAIPDPLTCYAISLDRRASTPDPVTAWMGVAGSGVTQPEAALEVREPLAGCRCRRLLLAG